MYIYIVEHLGARVAFKTCKEAERYIEMMYGDDQERIVIPTICPCLFVEAEDE